MKMFSATSRVCCVATVACVMLAHARVEAAEPAERATTSTPYSAAWFRTTDGYAMVLEVLARPDKSVPGVTVDRLELDGLLDRVSIGKRELRWVRRYASATSRRKQRARVRSVRDVLLSKPRLARGRRFAAEHADVLDRVSTHYGVDRADLLAPA